MRINVWPSLIGGCLAIFMMCCSSPAQSLPKFSDQDLSADPLKIADYKKIPIALSMPDGGAFGLAQKDVLTHIELRLRSAGLQPLDLANFPLPGNVSDISGFSVGISMRGEACLINLDYARFVSWTPPGQSLITAPINVWHDYQFGIFGKSSNFISELDIALDRFLNSYLKANQETAKSDFKK